MAKFPAYKTARVADLIPYARNSRTHSDAQVDKIAASMREFGFLNPVIVDGDNGIIAGHGRIMAAKKLGMDEVPTVEASHLTEHQKRAYVIADNRLALDAEWDDEMLRVELSELQDADFDVELTGFTLDEIEALEPEVVPEEGLTDEDATPEAPEQPVTVEGDVWVLGNHRLMCGDSTSVDAVERLMDGHKAQLCFTSPPYNLGKSVSLRNGARKGADSAYNDFTDDADWVGLMRGFLNNAILSSEVLCINVQMLSGNKIDLLNLFGEYAASTVDMSIWVKSNPQPAMAEGVTNSAFEFIWILSDEDKPNRRIKSASFDRGTFSNVYTHATASGHDASVHGAVFPLPVAEHYISNCSHAGSVVFEPFCGSGTTLVACEKINRKCYAIELDPKYCDVIIKRWQDFTGKQATHEESGKTFEEVADGR